LLRRPVAGRCPVDREVAVVLIVVVVTAHDRLRLRHLRLSGGDDAIIVFRVLQIVLGRDTIAGRLSITRELDVFLGNMQRRPANLYVTTIAFE
jgi:hypothetical protein